MERKDIWIGNGIWDGWRLTTNPSSSSDDENPVFIGPDDTPYKPEDIKVDFSHKFNPLITVSYSEGDIWVGKSMWIGWKLTTNHPATAHNIPVLVDQEDIPYFPKDISQRLGLLTYSFFENKHLEDTLMKLYQTSE